METLTAEKIEQQNARREEMRADILRPLKKKMGITGKLWVAFLLVVIFIGVYAWFQQLNSGFVTTGLNNVASWGLYISTFVFFVAIALVGALMSGVLRLANATKQRPLSRIAEMIALAGVIMAALSIIVDMGRPDRLLNVFLHARIQSPILWDVMVVTTYTIVCFLLFWIPCLPGMAICRNSLTDKPKWQKWLYKVLALRWNGTPTQWKLMKKSYAALCILVIPIGVSIHTVTSWLFATIFRPGWNSTNFGPYFVTGAFLAGIGGLVIGVYVFRNIYDLKKYLKDEHFDFMGKLMIALAAIYLYFNINEYFIPYYHGIEAHLLDNLFFGRYALLFWSSQIFGVILPMILPLFRKMRKPKPLFFISLLLVISHWIKRYLIVTPTSEMALLPMDTKISLYYPSWVEISIFLALVAMMLLIITILARLFPIISIWETLENEGIELDELDKLKIKKS